MELLKKKIAEFIKERDWEQFHNPKDLSMSLSIESAELMELYQWKNPEEINALINNPESFQKMKDELADIVIYSLSLANTLNIDVAEAVIKKLKKNEKKYPVKIAKGNAKKYTEL